VRKGTLIDATVIGSASKGDKRSRLGTDKETGSSARSRPYGDRAHDALSVEPASKAKGGVSKLLRKGIAGAKAREAPAPSKTRARTHSPICAGKNHSPRTGLVSRETFWYDWRGSALGAIVWFSLLGWALVDPNPYCVILLTVVLDERHMQRFGNNGKFRLRLALTESHRGVIKLA
jgi:hypothetical protein